MSREDRCESPQEYINIPKDSILIIERYRTPCHGNLVVVMEQGTRNLVIAEYVRDIMSEYVRSIIQIQHHQEKALISLETLQIIGVVLESRKIFVYNK